MTGRLGAYLKNKNKSMFADKYQFNRKSLIVTIPGRPVPQKLIKTARKLIRPQDFINYKKAISLSVKAQLKKIKFNANNAIWSLSIYFCFFSKDSHKIGKPKISKPDIDNLIKGVLDALQGILYVNDSQVYKITARKFWGTKDETIIKLFLLSEEDRNK